MKILSFELSKKLNDLGLLDNIYTEFIYTKRDIGFGNIDYNIIKGKYFDKNDGDIKTLTLEEAIEFLPIKLNIYEPRFAKQYLNFYYKIVRDNEEYLIFYENLENNVIIDKGGKTLQIAIEKMLEYLIDNKLIGKNTN